MLGSQPLAFRMSAKNAKSSSWLRVDVLVNVNVAMGETLRAEPSSGTSIEPPSWVTLVAAPTPDGEKGSSGTMVRWLRLRTAVQLCSSSMSRRR